MESARFRVAVVPLPWSAVPARTRRPAETVTLDEDLPTLTGLTVRRQHIPGQPDPALIRQLRVHSRHSEPETPPRRELHTRPTIDDQLVTGTGIRRGPVRRHATDQRPAPSSDRSRDTTAI